MWDAKNLSVRAETCVFCHYQIDAKMLDAGHPDLTFELGYFQKTMPEHWEETPDKGEGYAAKVAVMGQAISLREAFRKVVANGDPASKAQMISHSNLIKAMGLGSVSSASDADTLFKKLAGKKFSKGDVPKFMNSIASDGHLTGSPGRKDAEQAFMTLDGLYSKYGNEGGVLDVLDSLYYGLYDDNGKALSNFDGKAFGANLAKLKGLIK